MPAGSITSQTRLPGLNTVVGGVDTRSGMVPDKGFT
jgi:hypothetical protein